MPGKDATSMRKPGNPAIASIPSAILLALLFSCATNSGVPSVFLQTPSPDAVNTYFTGSASGPDIASATGDASANLIAGIMQYIGVSVKVNTEAKAKATLDSYTAEIRQSVETQSDNRLSGFQIKQKYVQKDAKSRKVTVYILASYITVDLNREKQRIIEIFTAPNREFARIESEADDFASDGQGVEAVRRYIDAMYFAMSPNVDNAEIKLKGVANKARSVLAGMRFVLPGGLEYKANLGATPSLPFTIRLVSASNGFGDSGVAGASLNVSYPKKQTNGRMGTKTTTATTDASGSVSLPLPAPDFVGKGKITAQLDLSSAIEVLDGIGGEYASIKAAVEDDIRSKSIDVNYIVVSNARAVPMGIYAVDMDEKGKLLGSDAMQSGILEILGKEGFSLRVAPIDPAFAASMSDDRVLAAARQASHSGFDRFAYGMAKVESVRKDGGFYVVAVSGRFKVVELSSGRILYAADKSSQSVGSDEQSARRAALRELGTKVFGPDLASSLP
jgi:hypothetical protein